MDKLEKVEQSVTKMIRSLQSITYNKTLKELDSFSLKKRRLMEDLVTVFKYLTHGYGEDKD